MSLKISSTFSNSLSLVIAFPRKFASSSQILLELKFNDILFNFTNYNNPLKVNYIFLNSLSSIIILKSFKNGNLYNNYYINAS